MRLRLFWRRHRRIAEADQATAAAEEVLEQIAARGPEVSEKAMWARDTRERNHLSRLFATTIQGGHS